MAEHDTVESTDTTRLIGGPRDGDVVRVAGPAAWKALEHIGYVSPLSEEYALWRDITYDVAVEEVQLAAPGQGFTTEALVEATLVLEQALLARGVAERTILVEESGATDVEEPALVRGFGIVFGRD